MLPRRCLIPADGFYEWQRIEGGKQPYYFSLKADQIFAFAGLYEVWESSNGDVLETCTILTTSANDLVSPIHDRMPVIIQPKYYDLWLDPSFSKIDSLQVLLEPYSAEAMKAYPVNSIVNSPKNDTPECRQQLS
jgi:putative SOS response-associated peptidase YedK